MRLAAVIALPLIVKTAITMTAVKIAARVQSVSTIVPVMNAKVMVFFIGAPTVDGTYYKTATSTAKTKEN